MVSTLALAHLTPFMSPRLSRPFLLPAQGADGAARLPRPVDVLEATAAVCNDNAYAKAEALYSAIMDASCGRGRPHMPEEEVRSRAHAAAERALVEFDKLANFPPESARRRKRAELVRVLEEREEDYVAANADREPWRAAQPVLFGIALFIALYIFRIFVDIACAPWLDVCRRASQVAGFLNSVLMGCAMYLAYQSGSVTLDKLRALFSVASAVAAGQGIQLPPALAAAVNAATAGTPGAGPGHAQTAAPPATLRGDKAAAAAEDELVDGGGGGGGSAAAGLGGAGGLRRRARPGKAE
jgi:hypothetical protein